MLKKPLEWEGEFLKPADLLFLISLAIILFIVVAIILIIFRKRKKASQMIVGVIVGGYVIFFALYPSIRSYMHAQRYDELEEYLQNTYSTEEFNIESRDYDNVIQFGDFDVSNKNTPNRGVTYRVKKGGEIIQLDGSWQKSP